MVQMVMCSNRPFVTASAKSSTCTVVNDVPRSLRSAGEASLHAHHKHHMPAYNAYRVMVGIVQFMGWLSVAVDVTLNLHAGLSHAAALRR